MTILKYIQSISGKALNVAMTTGNTIRKGLQQEYISAKNDPLYALQRFLIRTRYEPPNKMEAMIHQAMKFDKHKTYPILTKIRLKIKPFDHQNIVNDITILCFLLTLITPFFAYILSRFLLHKRTERKVRMFYMWYLTNTIFYLVLGTSYIYYSFRACSESTYIGQGGSRRTHCGVIFSETTRALVWREYSKADTRYSENNETIVSIQIFSTLVHGVISGLICWLIWYNKRISWFWTVIVATGDVYGTFIRFCTEWLYAWKHLRMGNWLYFGVYIVGYNGLTVVMSLMALKIAREQCDKGIKAMRRLEEIIKKRQILKEAEWAGRDN